MAEKAGIVIFLIALIFVMGTTFLNKPFRQSRVTIGGKTVKVEVAQSIKDKEKGLSGRAGLPEGSGMLFVFPKPDYYGFWMKDMNFPIDIIWIGQDYKVVDVSADVSPATFPKIFLPKEPAQFVLEVNSGWSKETKVMVGDSAKVEGLSLQ